MTPLPLKNYHIVMLDSGNVASWSLGWRKKDCIANYLLGIGHAENDKKKWRSALKRGHRVVKVNVDLHLVNS